MTVDDIFIALATAAAATAGQINTWKNSNQLNQHGGRCWGRWGGEGRGGRELGKMAGFVFSLQKRKTMAVKDEVSYCAGVFGSGAFLQKIIFMLSPWSLFLAKELLGLLLKLVPQLGLLLIIAGIQCFFHKLASSELIVVSPPYPRTIKPFLGI